MLNRSSRLMWQFFWLYLGIALFGAALITVNNIFINGSSIKHLMTYNLKGIAVQVAALAIIFQAITFLRLAEVRRFLREGDRQANLPLVWNRLINFPNEVFWGMVVFALINSPLFHIGQHLALGQSLINWDRFQIYSDIKSFFFEQAICLMLAILFYIFTRRIIRPYLLTLPGQGLTGLKQSTFMKPLMITFCSILLITVFSISWYVLRTVLLDKPLEFPVLLGIGGFNVIFGFFILAILASEFRRELMLLLKAMSSLLGEERAKLHGKIPVISRDEVGGLGTVFNQLQERILEEYREIDTDLRLAYSVQQRLLPKAEQRFGQFSIAGACQPSREVGGDFFDMLNLDQHRFVVITGDVSGKGMPAALLMSALLTLFRATVRQYRSAEEVLNQMNLTIEEIVQGDMFLTLGIAVFDSEKKTLEYASAGHMAPYLIRGAKIEQIQVSSLPMGVNKDEIYDKKIIPIEAGDRFIFYTDGIVEAFINEREILGFAGFEGLLAKLDRTLPVAEQVQLLLKQLPRRNGAIEDDRTLVMVEVA
ncbi:MAG: PP2C family protein-serine/threonine phosphatase [Thermincola sp.]|nr:PP2C family protein-serine/threonine phosphatase [Thermincola sp.]